MFNVMHRYQLSVVRHPERESNVADSLSTMTVVVAAAVAAAISYLEI